MDIDVIQAPPEFRLKILALMLNSDWLARYGTAIKPEYFPQRQEQEFVMWVNEYWDKYRAIPSMEDMHHGLKDSQLIGTVLACDPDGLQYAADVAMDFAQSQAMKIAILESVDDIKTGNLHKPMERVKMAQSVGMDKLDLGLELVADMDSWVGEELHGKRWPTGWPPVDRVLDGGLSAGEYGICMAPPGMGKTTMLVNIGYGMAGLLGCANVLHVSLEIPKEQVLARYAARVAGVRLRRDDDSMTEKEFKADLHKRAKQRLRGRLRVVDNAKSVADIEALMEKLDGEGFHTEALIVDYPDLMNPSATREEKRFELADISRELRALGADRGVPVWGASQTGRDTFYKEVITSANIAEAIEKVAVADIILALCQTKDEESLNQGRIFMAKVRKAASHGAIPVKISFEHQSIVCPTHDQD